MENEKMKENGIKSSPLFTTLTSGSYTVNSYLENQLKLVVSFYVSNNIPLHSLG